jgi:hypothetical protein
MTDQLMTDTHPLTEAFAEVGVWAIWLDQPRPAHKSPCPFTGWVHEGREPYRVIVATDPFDLPRLGDRRPYTGDEPTVDVREWLSR